MSNSAFGCTIVKLIEVYPEIIISSTRTIATCTRRNSKPEDHEGLNLDEVLNMKKDKNKADRKAKGAAQKAACNNLGSGRAREPAVML